MTLFTSAQSVVVLVLGIAAFGVEILAFADALRYRDEVYRAAGKRTKTFWLVVTGLGVAIGFVVVRNVLTIFGIAAFVGAAVYLADVRPALRSITGGAPRRGPYGPW